jgi:hypothetical protein
MTPVILLENLYLQKLSFYHQIQKNGRIQRKRKLFGEQNNERIAKGRISESDQSK